MNKFVYLILLSILPFYQVLSQIYNVSGTITDSLNNPLQYVNIIIEGTGHGTASDEDGNYKLDDLEPGIYPIKFSAIGYSTFRKENLDLRESSLILNVILKERILESEEIVVTAGKYEQKRSELPVSTEIIRGREFSEKNFSNLEDALRYVPGVNITDDQISIRGSSGYSRGAGSRALLAIDGIPFYTGDTGEIVWEMIPVTELQRVEIIKGAASSLYGSSAIGGVINGITKDITSRPKTMVQGFFGVYDKPHYKLWDWSGEYRPFNGLTLSHSNMFGKLGINISFTRLENSSYRQNDFFKKYIVFLKSLFNFSPTSSLTFIANTFNKRAGSFIYWKNSRNALVPPDINQGERIETNRYLFGLIYKNVLSEKIFLNIKASYYLNDWDDNATPINASTSNLYRGEVQLNFSLSDNIVLVTGIEGNTASVKSNLFGNPNSNSVGVYALSDINFSFPLIMSIGLRYDYSKLDTLDGSNAFSPKLGLNYKLTDNLILRSSVGTGFRAPSLAEAFTSTSASGITVKPNPLLKSESNLSMELGLNYDAFNLLNLDLALFRNEYFDMIEPGIDPADGLVVFDNVIRARIEGLEANTTFRFIPDELTFKLSYTYMWARDVEMNTALKYRPRHIFYSRLEFRKWNLELGIDFRYWSKVKEIDNELIDLGIIRDGELRVSVFATDFRAGYNLVSVGLPVLIYLNIKNLTNYNYVELIGNIRPIRNFTFGFNLIL